MKKTIIALTIAGFASALAVPAIAMNVGGEPEVIYAKKKCKKDQMWDKKAKKCVKEEKKEGKK